MRVLLDESLPRPLSDLFVSAEVETVPGRGWAGLKNGELLTRASADFDVFVTADQNLPYQQNLSGYDIGVVVMAGVSNRLADLRSLVPATLEACHMVEPGQVIVVRPPDTPGAS